MSDVVETIRSINDMPDQCEILLQVPHLGVMPAFMETDELKELTNELAAERERRVAAEAVVDFYDEDEFRWYLHPVCNALLHGHRGHVCDKWKLAFNYKGNGYDKAREYRKHYPNAPLGAGEENNERT